MVRFQIALQYTRSHGVDKFKVKFSEYNALYNDEVQQDFFECLPLLIDIINYYQ